MAGTGGSFYSESRIEQVEIHHEFERRMKKEAAQKSIQASVGTGEAGVRKTRMTSVEKIQRRLDALEEPVRSGALAEFVESRKFEVVSCVVILSNAVFTAVSTDGQMRHLGQSSPSVVQYAEYFYLAYYAIELILRVLVHKAHFFVNREFKWNIFDFILVSISLFDFFVTSVLSMEAGGNVTFMRAVRLLKMSKIFRTLRVLRVFEDLAQILRGFAKSMMSLFWCFLMLAFILYMFSLVLMQGMTEMLIDGDLYLDDLLREKVREEFGSLPRTMLTFYICATGGDDWKNVYGTVEHAGTIYSAVFLFFTFFFNFAVFNILTGIFVEKAMSAAQPDRDQMILDQRRKILKDVQDLKIVIGELKKDRSDNMTWDEFLSHMQNEEVVALFSSIGLHLNDAKMFFDMLCALEGGESVSVDTFVEGCFAMKGTATSLDMQRQLFELQLVLAHVKRFEEHCMERFDNLSYSVRDEFQEVTVLHREMSERLDTMPEISASVVDQASPSTIADMLRQNELRVSNLLNEHRAKADEIWQEVKRHFHASQEALKKVHDDKLEPIFFTHTAAGDTLWRNQPMGNRQEIVDRTSARSMSMADILTHGSGNTRVPRHTNNEGANERTTLQNTPVEEESQWSRMPAVGNSNFSTGDTDLLPALFARTCYPLGEPSKLEDV